MASDFADNPDLAFGRVVWRLDAIDKWRGERVDPTLTLLEQELGGLVKADEVTKEVAKLLRERQTFRLGLVGWIVACLAGLATLGSFCLNAWLAVRLG